MIAYTYTYIRTLSVCCILVPVPMPMPYHSNSMYVCFLLCICFTFSFLFDWVPCRSEDESNQTKPLKGRTREISHHSICIGYQSAAIAFFHIHWRIIIVISFRECVCNCNNRTIFISRRRCYSHTHSETPCILTHWVLAECCEVTYSLCVYTIHKR